MALAGARLMGRPFGTRGSVIVFPFSFWMWRIGRPEGALCSPVVPVPVVQGVVRRRVVLIARCAGVGQRLVVLEARCAGVVRRPVVLKARFGSGDRRGAWFPIEARCAGRATRCA